MVEFNIVNKLGSSASEIALTNGYYVKTHKTKKLSEVEAIVKGIKILSDNCPGTIELPTFINEEKLADKHGFFSLTYYQKDLKPWIKPEWITGEQLYQIGLTILKQQSALFKVGLCLVDARPHNYWLAHSGGLLIDLGSIKPLTRQNLLSFESDFQKHFTNPLTLEIELDIPIALYYKGQIQSCNVNLWGLNRNLRSIAAIKDLFKFSLVNYISNIISSSSPEFIAFLNSESELQENKIINNKKARGIISKIEKRYKVLKPITISQSNWNNYEDFHDKEYHLNKIKQIKNFVNDKKEFTKIVDLGSNLTTRELDNIHIRIDNDLSTCRKMRQVYSEEKIILQINIADSLCHNANQSDNPLNCVGTAKAAVMTGLIHHLIIDYGLRIDIFYRQLSRLYNDILLEFPSSEDPMVKLLMRKRNEIINWSWDENHMPICSKYFEIVEKTTLSKTRLLFQLKNKENKC